MFLKEISEAILKAVEIDIIVSFVLKSGVELLLEPLKTASSNGAKVRVLTSTYLNITEPSALVLLKDSLGDNLDLRVFKYEDKHFHPKAYIFEFINGDGELFVGSSNISKDALTGGIEWNYRISKSANPEHFEYFKRAFFDLFNNHSVLVDNKFIEQYAEKWATKKSDSEYEGLKNLEKDIYVFESYESETDLEEIESTKQSKPELSSLPVLPNEVQQEVLRELNNTRAEGFTKALVVLATGVGKTFLAAFDSMQFNKVLFVAHREEILKQAKSTFGKVRPAAKMGLFNSQVKDKDKDIVFASVFTIGKDEYLNESYFPPDYFDYIVIDEFHHAAAESYKKLLNYFKPKFLLGLTATPERMDGKDVFEICDYNVVYDLRLTDAVNRGYLVPFHYYGIYDETDFSKIPIVDGHYKEDELEKVLIVHKRADLVLSKYLEKGRKKALGFCVSKAHAEYMADYFNKNGVKACAVYSGEQGENAIPRWEAIEKFRSGQLEVIFTVDVFNEGVDIPEIEMVMFLRPTESPTVFIQQLGRGLRKAKNKEYLIVLDFIGNYKNAVLIPFIISQKEYDLKMLQKEVNAENIREVLGLPEWCEVDFDFRVIDLFKKMARDLQKIEGIIYDEYLRIKKFLGYRPLRHEFYKYVDEVIYRNMRKNAKFNILNDYISFLYNHGELFEDEMTIFNTIAHKFINFIEKTTMTKSYKMPVLLAFYNNGHPKLCVTPDDIYMSFKEFYSSPANAVDLKMHSSTKDFETWGKDEWVKLSRKNPEHYLEQTHGEFFGRKGELFCLNEQLERFLDNPAFVEHFRDSIEYRTIRYYKERIKHG
ncbi:MAG: DEAD/DEAH box helicase family protein [Fervidobacterium sp.]|uniref:DEAD/DEAH box helicase family protein n=1 Tax=Fervidobacterium sp. TaxID=1871331 RepID=UPI00404B55ED